MYRRNGSLEYVRCAGFISLLEAKRIKGAIPVKLYVHSTKSEDDLSIDWGEMLEGKFVQGCLMGDRAYAVIDLKVRLV